MKPYLTIIAGELVQDSPLNTGGNAPKGSLVDQPLARDGAGRPVLRGSALAGCLVATASSICGSLPRSITGKTLPRDAAHVSPSAWRFRHAHVLNDAIGEHFQHVGIRQATGASADDHLFDREAMPVGTRWFFLLEIVPAPDGQATHEQYAVHALEEWRRPGGCRMGRGSHHGYGWMHLENLRVWSLKAEHFGIWPNALHNLNTPQQVDDYFAQHALPSQAWDAFRQQHEHATCTPPVASRFRREILCELTAGERKTGFGAGYGLDSLSLGGHARLAQTAEELEPRLLKSTHINLDNSTFTPDFMIHTLRDASGTLRPCIPGASIRGVLRHAVSRLLRAQGAAVTDPCGPDKFAPPVQEDSRITALFGNTQRAGALSVSDAHPVDDSWDLVWWQHHATDEFSGGVFGSSKFDRLAITKARFRFQLHIEAATAEQAEELASMLEGIIKTLGYSRHLPVGGGQRRGHGHLEWKILDAVTRPLGVQA